MGWWSNLTPVCVRPSGITCRPKIPLKFLRARPKPRTLGVLRCEVAIRTTISLVAVLLLAALVSGCPSGKKSNGAREACAQISNTLMQGNDCLCMEGYTKNSPSGGSDYDFTCQQDQTCLGGAQMVNGACQCTNGKPYNPSNTSSPCGEFAGGGGRLGLTAQQLQTACTGVGQWQNDFCLCPGGQQFNALTSQCEAIVWHHTQTMCGAGAKFYGQQGRGVCVCQNDQALFHPSFGGCSTLIGTTVIDSMCKNLYGVSDGYVGGRCACPSGRVWFRGSCLDLGNDFVTQVPSLPPELGCELKGMRVGPDGQCQAYGGGYIGHNNGPNKPIICRRDSLVANMGKETIELHRDRVRVTIERGPSSFTQDYQPQEYFRIRCEEYALSPGPREYWASGKGVYKPLNPPYFGKCYCDAGYTAAVDHDLGYSYCVATGHPLYAYSRCEWAVLCGSGFNISVGADRSVSFDGEICTRDGARFSFGVQR